jgi:hydroxymethylpyrimidine/phosphomethylpyrimidine kinase
VRGRVLIVAGSDSGGGAGIQADIKAVTALGGYAMTAVTALTAQDTHGVQAVMPVPPDFIALQMRLCLADIGADAVKTGMLASAEIIETVAEVLSEVGVPALVVDPVMAAKGGQRLLEDRAL